jgi:hypothetical protein
MESAEQASHYLQGLSRCSVPFCHWTFRNRKLGFFFKWKAPWVVVGSGLTLAVIVLVVGLLAELVGPSVSTTGAGLSY